MTRLVAARVRRVAAQVRRVAALVRLVAALYLFSPHVCYVSSSLLYSCTVSLFVSHHVISRHLFSSYHVLPRHVMYVGEGRELLRAWRR